jgi:hypothetical protein
MSMPTVEASPLVSFGIPAIALAVVGLFLAGVARAGRAVGDPPGQRAAVTRRAAAGIALWLAATGGLAAAGALARFDVRPPPFMAMMILTIAATIALARSGLGARLARGLPLAALVGAQAFRLPLELVMHRAAAEGVMPVAMSFGGYNFDIVSGATAALLAILLAVGHAPRWLVLAWNLLGLALLVNIVAIAVAATPLFHAFGTAPEELNTWVAAFPFVYLPTVLVPAALLGHLVIFRRLAGRAPATVSA